MKHILSLIAALSLAVPAMAQESPTQTFFQSATAYFTTLDTNKTTFRPDQDTLNVFAGPESQQGVGMNAIFGARWNFVRQDTGLRLGLGGVIRNTDISGTINSLGTEFVASKVKWDVKMTGGLGIGYTKIQKSGYAELFAEVSKALTENTFAGIRLSHQFAFKKHNTADVPIIALTTGFTW